MQSNRVTRRLTALEPWQRTLYVLAFAQWASVAGFSTIFPFLPLYVKALGSSTGTSLELLAGLVFSSQAFTMMFASPLWGAVADRFGRKPMVERAMFGGAVTVLAMGFVASAEQLVVLRAVQGLITGIIAASNALVAASVPRDRLGQSMGIMQTALWSGQALGPLLGGVMADTFGYRAAFVVTGVMLFAAGLLVTFFVHERFERDPAATIRLGAILAGWRRLFAAPGMKGAYTLRFMIGLAGIMLVPIAPLFVVELLPAGSAVNLYTGLVIAVSGAASTLTAIYLGRLGDQIGHRKVLIASVLAVALFYLPLALVTAAWQLLLLVALAGAASGGVITSLAALLATYSRPDAAGSVYGLDNSILAASRAVAPMLATGMALWVGFGATLSLVGVLYLLILGLIFIVLPRTQPTPALAPGD